MMPPQASFYKWLDSRAREIYKQKAQLEQMCLVLNSIWNSSIAIMY